MATLQSWRRAYGALKDTTTVSLAKVNSQYKELDVAIVKATNHVERPPKERHVKDILIATSEYRPRADVAYCMRALSRRLAKTRNWVVALKTLVVIHRALREGDPTFREELLHYSHKTNIFQISNFKDNSSSFGWACSAWLRTYALFLEERLECFRVLRYDIEAERIRSDGSGEGHSRTRTLSSQELLEQLPALQQLLSRLVDCQPEGAAFGNNLIQYALALVLRESFKLYCAINDGIINLVDLFFEMPKHDALKAFDIYKRAGRLTVDLAKLYELCKGLELARNFDFTLLKEPPPSIIPTMEEYVREAPRVDSFSNMRLEYQQKHLLTYKEEGSPSPESLRKPVVKLENELKPVSEPIAQVAHQKPTSDFLGMNEVSPMAAELEESNALALAIVPSGTDFKPTSTSDFTSDSLGWELALVSTPSKNINLLSESKLAGGFDMFLLDSLYDEGARRQQNKGANGSGLAANPFNSMDPFAMSNNIPPPTNVQMAFMPQQHQHYIQQQQQYYYYQQQGMTLMAQTYQPHQAHPQFASSNPFDDPYASFPQMAPVQGSQK